MVGPYVEDRNTVAVLLAPCFLKLPTISDLGLELKVQASKMFHHSSCFCRIYDILRQGNDN